MTVIYWPKILPWSQIFADLEARNCGLYRVGIRLGKEWSTVQKWRREGWEPRHSDGVAILRLHTEVCGQDVTLKRLTEAVEYV